MITAILFLSFFVMLLIGMPIALCLGMSAVFALLYASAFDPQFANLSLNIIATNTYTGTAKFLLLAIPFFVLSGNIMAKAGISTRLIRFIDSLIGHKRGGMAIVCVIVSVFFGAISGSGPATVAALGAVLIPAMIESGFSAAFAEALMAASSSIAIVIPPSIAFVVYASIVGGNVGELFMAGLIPGILMGLALIIVVLIEARKKNIQPAHEKRSGKEVWDSFKDAFWGLLMPVIILGGIYGGIFTPTEAAAVSVVYGIFVSMVIYRDVTWKDLGAIFIESAKTSGGIMLIVASASLFSYCCTLFGISQAAQALLSAIGSNQIVFLLIVNVIFLIAGCFIDANSAMYIFIPIMAPVAQSLGYSLTAFGVLATVNLAIGQVTPPVGVNLFVAMGLKIEDKAKSAADKVKRFHQVTLPMISKAVWPMIASCLVVLMIVTFIPQTSLLLVGGGSQTATAAAKLLTTDDGLSYHAYDNYEMYDAKANAAVYDGEEAWPVMNLAYDCSTGESSSWAQGGYYFNALMQNSTGGRVKVDVYPGEQLTNGDQVAGIQALMDGNTLQVSMHSNLIYAGFDPRFNVVSLPFLFPSTEDVDAAMNGAGGDALKDVLSEYGLVCMAIGENGYRQITNSKHPIASLSDLSDIKLRICSNDLCAEMYKQWGTSATAMNWAETYTSLQQGAIDGQENPEPAIGSASVQDVQDYISQLNGYYDCLFFCMNGKVFDQFSDAQKAVILENAQKAADYQKDVNREQISKLMDEWDASGAMEVTRHEDIDVDSFRNASDGVYTWYEKQLQEKKGMSADEAKAFIDAFRTNQ